MGTMERDREGPPDRELYALLHLSPEASDDDVKRAYRQWAQVYHPDKHQTLQMQDIATQNFQKIREAYEILSDERKRQIYDLYGMEGLTSGLELGPKLKSREEVRAEFERLQQRQEERKLAAHVHHRGSLLMNLSLVPFLESYDAPRMNGMAMSTQVQAQVSKRDTMVLGGNMALRRGLGGGSVTMVLRRQLSPISTVEILAMVGLRSILSLQTSRQLSTHSTGTLGLSVSLRDGSVTLANTWSRQLSEDTTGNIQLVIGPDTGISVGWQKHGKKNAGSADVKVGPATFGVSGQYIRHFSSKSQGRVTGKIGSTGVEVELGGERRLSEHSSAAMFCVLGLQGISWKVRFTRGGQKFVIPIMLCTTLNPFIATGALIIPSSIYALLKTYVFKPYNLRRNRRKSLELRRTTYTQVMEARASSERSQLLLKNVAERKKQKQAQRQGLVILAAIYGDIKAYERGTNFVDKSASTEDDDADLPPPYLDVAIPVQFLVDDFGQLRLHEGVKKAGLMGFCDPCPGEAKQLKVAYTYLGHQYEVVVGDYDELRIPQEAHRIQRAASEKLDQVFVSRSCSVDLNESDFEYSSPKLNGEKLPGQCLINPLEQLKGGQSEIIEVEIESTKDGEIQQVKGFHNQSKPLNIEDVKYASQVSFDGELENNGNTISLPKLCNILGPNSPVYETSYPHEVQKYLFTKGNDQDVSLEEMSGIIIELVDSLHSQAMQLDKSLDTKSMAKLIINKQDSSILTYEDLTLAFQIERFSSEKIPLVEVADKHDILKGVTMSSVPKNLERWSNEAQRLGLGWVLIDDSVIGFRVDSVQAWLVALILIHESQSDVKIHNTVDFKFAVDAHIVENQQRIICEVMLELLCNPSPLYCVSVAKWEGKDQCWDEIFSHMAKIMDSKNLLQQLKAICEDGLDIEDRHLNVTFIECHHMAYYRSIVCNGRINALSEQFCPWCTIPQQARCAVTMNHNISKNDTIALLSSTYHMRPQLLVELNKSLEDIHPKDKINEFLPNLKSIIVFQHWPINRHDMCKLTQGPTLSSVYCARHALTHTILHMVRTLGMQAQQHDQISNEAQSRFMLLWQAMTNPPLLIECKITPLQHTNYKEIKYDEFNMEVASHILENHEKLLKVMKKIPTLEVFMYTKRMWATYHHFNRLQQMSHPHTSIVYDESLAVVAKEFLYYAIKALGEDITPYIHIQGAHAHQFQSLLPYPIGRLKNLAMERKHKAFKNSIIALRTTGVANNPCTKQDKLGLNTEMVAQYVRLKMEAMPILNDLKRQFDCWIPWLARSFFRRHFIQMGHIAISFDKAEELAEIFPTTTTNQVFCLFNIWSKHIKRQSKFKALHFSKGLSVRFNKDLSTMLQKNEAQQNAYANMKCNRKNDSYINQHKFVVANNEFSLSNQILNNEELQQIYNSAILYNFHLMEVDEQYLSNRIYIDNEIHNQNEGKLIENTTRCIDGKNGDLLNEKSIGNDCHNIIKEKILNEKTHHPPQQSIAFTDSLLGIESPCARDGEGNNQKYDFDSNDINIDVINNYKKLENCSAKYYKDDVINDDNITNAKNIIIQTLHNKPSEVVTFDMDASVKDSKDLSHSIIECHRNESKNSSKLLLDAKSKEISKEKLDNVEHYKCSNSMSLPIVKVQEKIVSNIHTKESKHLVEEKDKDKIQSNFDTKFDGILEKKILAERNALEQEDLYQNYQLESNTSKSNFKNFQNTIQNHSNYQNDISSDNKNNKHNELKISQNNLGNYLNEIFNTNIENEINNRSEYVNSIHFEVDLCASNIDDAKLNDSTNNNAIITNAMPNIVDLQVTPRNNDNALKILSLDNRSKSKGFKMDSIAHSHFTSSLMVEDTKPLKDLPLIKESIKKFDEQILTSLESYSFLNEKKDSSKKNLSANLTNDKETLNKNNIIDNENENSRSYSHSITPEDGGILKNKRHRIDDVFQNEKLFKLKSFEKSFNLLSEKSHTYKRLYTKKSYDNYNSPRTSNLQVTQWSMSSKSDDKEHSLKVNTLYNYNPYSLPKQDSNKKNIKTLYPCNPYPYPQNIEEPNRKKLYKKSNQYSELKVVHHSSQHNFEKKYTSQPLFAMKNVDTNLSSLKQESCLSSNQACNDNSILRNFKPNLPQYSKKNQFIEDDKIFFHSKRIRFQHHEYKDAENDIFMPFLFDDANFVMPSQISNASCQEEHKAISSNLKKKIVITPDTCMISTSSLQCQQTPEWFAQAQEISNPIVIPITPKNDNSKYNGPRKQNSNGIEILHFEEPIQVKRIESHILSRGNDYKETKGNVSNENEYRKLVKKLEEEFANIHDNNSNEKDKYQRPCCCNPSRGHATTCYQYIPNYEPPEVTRIINTSQIDHPNACMTCSEQCQQQYVALPRAHSEIPNYSDQCQLQSKTLRKPRKYYSSHLHSYRNLDKGDASIESNLSARTYTRNNVEKYCEYDRIGSYRRVEILRSKSRQKWKKI